MHPLACPVVGSFASFALVTFLVPCTIAAAGPAPPVADRKPHPTTLHGDTRPDDYFWLREKTSPKVIAYLDAENAYSDSVMAPLKPQADALYKEILSRIRQTDLSAPYRKGAWLYYTRTQEGKQYPYYCRRKGAMDAPEELLLDVNALAEGHKFMSVGEFEVSPDGSMLAYDIDSTGYRQYALRVRDLSTGQDLADHAERVTSIAWAADGKTLFYTQEDPVAKRSYRIYRHVLGSAEHTLVDEEKDEHFDIEVRTSRSGAWILQTRSSHTTSEVSILAASEPGGAFRVMAPRVHGREYYVDHRGDRFWIRVNDKGKNYRLVTAPVATPDPSHWTEVIAHRPGVMIEGVTCFEKYVVLSEREDGLPQILVLDPTTLAQRRMHFDEPTYAVNGAANVEFDAGKFRYVYQSFLTPQSVYDLDLATLAPTLVKRTEVEGGWDPSKYAVERVWATARDGAKIPISLLHRKDRPHDGTAPCLLYGYGSYGISTNATFSPARFSLVDRGMVYAIAHIRGGGEFGETWHDAARMQSKMNTFTDFIDCAQYLVDAKIARKDGLIAQGGSAGGLLMGAVVNLRPDLWKGVLAQVAFVDVLNTMLDESLPLTVGEFEEWGNPKIAEQYKWMRAYSPYDNVRATAYPSMLVRTSLNDSQVSYWEPTKFVARLRATKTDTNPLLLRCNMGAGHGGASGRYDFIKDTALDYAWMLHTVNLDMTTALP